MSETEPSTSKPPRRATHTDVATAFPPDDQPSTTSPNLFTPHSPQHLRPSTGPSSPSSSIPSTISDQDDDPVQPYSATSATHRPPSARGPGLISLARKGSTSSGRYLQLGSPGLGGGRSGTPISLYRSEGDGADGSVGVRARSRLGMVDDVLDSPDLAEGKERRSGYLEPDPQGGQSGSSRANSSSHDSILVVAPGGISSLPFPSPPARSGRRPLPTPLLAQPGLAQPPPLSPLSRAHANSLPRGPGRASHNHLPSQSSGSTALILSPAQPYSPFSAPASRTESNRFSGPPILSTENDHTFGHGTSTSPTTPLQTTSNRLSIYDPLGGGLSDIASFGTSPTAQSHLSPHPSPRSFEQDIHSSQLAQVTGYTQAGRVKSSKSSKSAGSGRSGKSSKTRSGSNKRTSGSSVAHRFADLSWTLRPGSPDEVGEGEGLLDGDEEEDAGDDARTMGQKKRKKSLRTMRREEQDLDLGRLLGRAAVLEKILNAGKRSLRFHPMRATDSPLPHPLPIVPAHHLYPQPRRRPFSLVSARTEDSSGSQTHTTASDVPESHPHPSTLPPLPPIPGHARPQARPQSASFSSSLSSAGQRRFTFGKRVRRDGEWGGEGYTSLPGSVAGSVEMGGNGGEEGGVILFPPDVAPPTPPKPAYFGQGRQANLGEVGEEPLSSEPGHRPAEIMLPPSCIPISARHTFHEDYRPSNRNFTFDQAVPARPVHTGEDEKIVYRQFGPNVTSGTRHSHATRRKSKVMSYVSTGQASWRSRRRWYIWVGVGCAVGLGVVSGVLGGVLGGRS